MNHRYLVLLEENRNGTRQDTHMARTAALQRQGMHCCLSTGGTRVFVSKGTPTLTIPDRGVLIGHLFADDATPVAPGHIGALESTPADLEKHLLDNYWGEYVLVLVSRNNLRGATILRDPSGGIACVYSITEAIGFITSHISIAENLGLYRRRTDWTYISRALEFTYLRTSRTGLLGVGELLPGCALEVRGSATSIRTSWSPWPFVVPSRRHRTVEEAAARIREAVATAVQTWAKIDGEILLELSGGLDSSIVAACLRGTGARVVCCTMVAPVAGTDERHYARQMAEHLGVELRTARISFDNIRFDFSPPADSVVPAMGILHYAADVAMAAAADENRVRSFFSGAGGDSVFCYLRGATPAADAFMECGFAAGAEAIADLVRLHQCPHLKATWLTLRKLLKGPKPPRRPNRSFLNPCVPPVVPEAHPWFAAPPGALPGDREKICDLAGSHSFAHGMARNAARPMRFPLLSQPVLEACLSVPSWMWISGGRDRSVARAAFADVLPADILHRRSKGTYVNYCGAVYARYKVQMLRFLSSGQLHARGLLDLEALTKFVTADSPPRDLSFFRVFELCMIENWIRRQA